MKIARQPEPATAPIPESSFTVHYGWGTPSKRPVFWFSSTEVKHVLIGVLLVSSVGLSLQRGLQMIGINNVTSLVFAVALFTLGFILHELAHKFTAQSYGLWAEFRLSMLGVVITAVSILSPIKFIAPGMVLIAGMATKDVFGRIASAGPITNLILAFLSLVFSLIMPTGGSRLVLEVGCWVNTYMALFNLIPFGDFDGLKIFRWSKVAWALIVAPAVALLLYVNIFVL